MDQAALIVDHFVSYRNKDKEHILTDRPERLEQAIRDHLDVSFGVEIEALLEDMRLEVRAERDRIQGVLDHQAEFPNDQYDPDEYLEGAVRSLDWVYVMLERRMKEVE